LSQLSPLPLLSVQQLLLVPLVPPLVPQLQQLSLVPLLLVQQLLLPLTASRHLLGRGEATRYATPSVRLGALA
jgi:hypothetical protein